MAAAATPTPDPTTDKPARPRRWIPLSLRLFVAMLLILGIVGVLYVGLPAYRQQEVIAEFDRLNVDYKKRPIGTDRLHGYLRKWNFDVDRLPHDVVSVRIGYDVYPRDFKTRWFQHLSKLEELKLEASWFGRVDLSFLAGLTKLRLLSLRWMRVSDADLRTLGGLRNLKVLDLTGTHVTDSGLMHLTALKNLTWVGVGGTHVTDAGIDALQTRLPDVSISTTHRDTGRYGIDYRDWWAERDE